MTKENESKGWIVVRAVSGEKYLCRCGENLKNHNFSEPAVLLEVREVVTMNLPMPNGNISRRTMLSDIDFSEGPRVEMHVLISSWYKPTKEELKWIKDEIAEANDRMAQSKRRMELMRKLESGTLSEEEKIEAIKEMTGVDPREQNTGSPLVLPVTAVPRMGGPGMPGPGGPRFGQ